MKHCALLCIVLSGVLSALQPPRIRWQWMNGPLYAPARNVLAHRGRLFITTPYVVWISRDDGRTWDRPSPPLATARQLASTERDMFRDDVDRVQRSEDAGQTWSNCGALPIDRRTGAEATSLAAHGQRVYVSVQRQGVFASTDRCRTWKKLAMPTSPDASLNVSFAHDDRVIVRGPAGSLLSSDTGATWTTIEAAVPDALTFDRYCGSMMLAGTSRGVRISRDGGRSWHGAGLEGRWVPAVASPHCGTLYAAVKDEARWTYSVMRSLDEGKSWSSDQSGLPPHPVYALTPVGSAIYASGVAGVFRTTGDGGWQPFGPPQRSILSLAATPWNVVLAAADDAVYSSAAAAPFRMLLFGHDAHRSEDHPLASATVLLSTAEGEVFAGGRQGVLRSTDRGETWSRAGLTHAVTALAITPNRTLVAGTRAGIFRSTDRGDTWEQRPLIALQPEILALATGPEGALLASTRGGEIFQSTSDGERWIPIGALPGAVHALVALRTGTVLAGNDFGCFQWRPRDNVWLPVTTQKPGNLRMVRALVQHPAGAVIAATDGLGVLVSLDEGSTWLPANDGLGVARVLSLAVGPEGSFYAGTTEGAFRGSM